MKNLLIKTIAISLLATLSSFTMADSAASTHASKASKHSALAGGHSVVGSVGAAASVVAIPLIVIGSAGVVSAAAGAELLDSNAAFAPLEISDEIILQDPSPAAAMQ